MNEKTKEGCNTISPVTSMQLSGGWHEPAMGPATEHLLMFWTGYLLLSNAPTICQ